MGAFHVLDEAYSVTIWNMSPYGLEHIIKVSLIWPVSVYILLSADTAFRDKFYDKPLATFTYLTGGIYNICMNDCTSRPYIKYLEQPRGVLPVLSWHIDKHVQPDSAE